ncbi:MAG: hypothetical protein Q4G55_05615, partial [bacterium]|nr:hypothetical protein [bacterium]
MRRRSGWLACAAWGMAWTVLGVAVPDQVDPRVRAYVAPTRVVWTSSNAGAYGTRSAVKNAEGLLAAKHGQVPEKAWLRPSGCTLVNNGDPAGVLLDFGR